MTKKIHNPVIRSSARPGELSVAVTKKITPLPDGTSHIEIGIDFAQVPIPDRRYTADVAGAVYDGTQVQLLFGQRKIAGKELRSLIVISMSSDAVHRFLATCEAFIPENTGFMQKHSIDRVALLKLDDEPAQTVAMTANIATLARAGREATADFYHASAASIHALKQRDALGLEPVVRVEFPVGLLASLLDELVVLSKKIPAEIS